jgi:hypothetical protein
MIGIADFADNAAGHPVDVKIEIGTDVDQLIGFNRAAGVNADDVQVSNAVTMVQTGKNRKSFSQSCLMAALENEGDLHACSDWAGMGDCLALTMVLRDLAVTPATAVICIAVRSTRCQEGELVLETSFITDRCSVMDDTSWKVSDGSGVDATAWPEEIAINALCKAELRSPIGLCTFTVHDSF